MPNTMLNGTISDDDTLRIRRWVPGSILTECSPPPVNLNAFKGLKELIKENKCLVSNIRGRRDIEDAIRTIGVLALAQRMAQS